jgi:hypothetical protein
VCAATAHSGSGLRGAQLLELLERRAQHLCGRVPLLRAAVHPAAQAEANVKVREPLALDG